MTRITPESHISSGTSATEGVPAHLAHQMASIQEDLRLLHVKLDSTTTPEDLKAQNAAMHKEIVQLREKIESLSTISAQGANSSSTTIQREFDRFNAKLDALPILGSAQKVLLVISRIKFVQDAAVMACPVAHWMDPHDRTIRTKELGSYKPVSTRSEYSLADEGLPDGVLVRFSSYVAGIGEYESTLWFKIRHSESCGANFRQTGTAFKGWINYTGLYYTLDSQLQTQASIARVKFIQNAAVSVCLLARWTDADGTLHTKNLGPYKPLGAHQEFNLIAEGIPHGSFIRFASNVAGIGEYTNDLVFKVDSDESVSKGATFVQAGTAFKGSFTFEDLYKMNEDIS
ncbi:hypothetical protein FB45DRAFT_1000484 [Roridomyces roridus]|uniref:Uncharacterized protein n=1 Tax=Roridomyces roridus TaxID=1738132 RepID=A0AAD7C911_9AGAR|nr:hypothetical protein FB45DRAFT_1000484 [Roridomyces roridus]